MKVYVQMDIINLKQWGRVVIFIRFRGGGGSGHLHKILPKQLGNGEQISWNMDYKHNSILLVVIRGIIHETTQHSFHGQYSFLLFSVFCQIKRTYVHQDIINVNK